MTSRGTTIAQRIAADLEDLREHARTEPGEADTLVALIVAHVRAWVPSSMPCELEAAP
ncbi:MAG: hypothetical protein NT062_30020 [Proteobacteria bacterium]|nr:hypothetical protein [Pseudomonadota bacterium]